jgi:hypothetical protein
MNYKTKLNVAVPTTTVEFLSIVNIVVTLSSWNPIVHMVIVKDHRCTCIDLIGGSWERSLTCEQKVLYRAWDL